MMATTLLASRRHADVGAAVHGDAVRQAAGVLQGRGRTARALERARHARRSCLQGLAEKGFGSEQLAEMQKIIDAEKSDLFDVLAHVAYALPPLTREERAAKRQGRDQHALQQQAAGLSRLRAVALRAASAWRNSIRKSSRRLLRLKYHNSIADAVADLGKPEEIGKVFAGFQKYLYQPQIHAGR